jgi:hypothetical protein
MRARSRGCGTDARLARYEARGKRFQVEMRQSAKSITSLIADVIFVSAVDVASGRLFGRWRGGVPFDSV